MQDTAFLLKLLNFFNFKYCILSTSTLLHRTPILVRTRYSRLFKFLHQQQSRYAAHRKIYHKPNIFDEKCNKNVFSRFIFFLKVLIEVLYCKQSTNKHVSSFSLCNTLFMCDTVSNLYNNNFLFHILLTQLFDILLTTEIFKPRLFCSHGTSHNIDFDSYWLPVACFIWPFIVQHNQYNERSWSRTFVFSLSWELYCDFIFACV